MSKTNNILAETLAEIQELREAVEKNANYALTSTLKGELEDIVKKNLDEVWTNEELTDDMPGDGLPGDQEPMGDNPINGDDNEELVIDPAGDMGGDEEVIDLTDQPDEEVIKHFDLMDPADEIEIVQKPDGGIQINIQPSEEKPEGDEESTDEFPADDAEETDSEEMKIAEGEMQDETTELEEEPIYELEISEDDVKDLEETVEETKDVGHQRDHFTTLSKNMYDLIKVSKTETPIYYQNCPMFNDGKGANWLSKENVIKNPYYGSQMLSCGKTVETIK